MEPRRKLLAFVLALETSLLSLPFGPAHADQGVEAREATDATSTAPVSRPSVSLQWVRAAEAQGCVDGRELARRVESKLRRATFGAPRDAELIIEGSAERRGDGYRAELRTYDAEGKALGSREVLSDRSSCDELSETVAVVLAVMIDPAGALNPSAPLPPVTPEPAPPAKPEPAPEPELPPPVPAPPIGQTAAIPTAHRPAVSPEASAFARGAYGPVPKLMWGGGVALELAFRRWGGVRIEAVALAERAVNLSGPPGAGAEVRAFYGSVLYCPLWGIRGRWRGAACAGLSAGAMQNRGFGFDKPKSSTSPLFDGVLSARGAVRVWRSFGVYGGGGLSVPFARTSFEGTLADRTLVELFQQPELGGQFDLGLGSRF